MNNIVNWFDKWNANGKTSIVWFFLFASLLVYFALKIVKNAEVLTVKTKFGGGVIGGVLIAIVTAAPEFITSIEQSLIGDPGAASSDNIGANAITGFLIGLAALLFIRETFLGKLKRWTIVTLWISFVISLTITIIMYFKLDYAIGTPGTYAIGIFPMLLLIIYFITLFLQYKFGDDDDHSTISEDYIKITSAKKASWMFVFWGSLLIIASIAINVVVKSMEGAYSISPDSAGGIFLSIAMAIPEAVAFFVLVKDKQYSAAVSTLVGHGFALFVSEWLADVSYANDAIYLTQEVHMVWAISIITTISFLLLSLQCLLAKKISYFRENKIIYSILPTLTISTFIIGWSLILTLYY